jgi:glycerophosphoryl diester phosphodiesterase
MCSHTPHSLSLRALTLAALCVASASAVEIIAHRGASSDAPDNTLPAFELAWEQGADGIEGDFFLTADQQIVCIHDRSTQRIAGEKLDVTRSSYASLRELDVGDGARIPNLEEVLNTVPDQGRVFIEIKDGVRLVEPLARQLEQTALPRSRLAVIAFDEQVVKACKQAIPDLKVHWLVSAKTYEKKGLDGTLATLRALDADGIDIQASAALTPKLGEALRAAGLEFHCWTVNDLPLARHMIALGVDSITTDRPAFIRRGALGKGLIVQRLSFDEQADGPPGIVGKALAGRVVNTNIPLPEVGTVALWYRPVAWYDFQTIFDSTSHPNEWELWINKTAEIGFRTTPADLRITYQLHPVAARDQWQHLAVTWTAGELRLYVNSALVVTTPRQAPTPSVGNFCLGGGHAGNERGRGHWDELLVLNAAVSDADIRTIMLDGIDAWLTNAAP